MTKLSGKPQVSIIMNCLNCAIHLHAALESVKAQTFQDWEIIFWDNGSTDGSGEIAKNFDERLRYFYNEKTVSLGKARNYAIAQAKGKYVAFLDCDDLWLPEKLAAQISIFEDNPKVGLVCTDTLILKGKNFIGRTFKTVKPGRGKVFAELMQRQWVSMSSAMVAKAALDSLVEEKQNKVSSGHTNPCDFDQTPLWFDPTFEVCEEADVFYRIAHDWELDYVDAPLTIWRTHANNTTFRKFDAIAKETLMILEKHQNLYPGYEREHKDLIILLTNRAIFQKAVSLWRNGKNKEARRSLALISSKSLKSRLFWLASFLPGVSFDICAKIYFGLPSAFRK